MRVALRALHRKETGLRPDAVSDFIAFLLYGR
jgi:hypothetical protein